MALVEQSNLGLCQAKPMLLRPNPTSLPGDVNDLSRRIVQPDIVLASKPDAHLPRSSSMGDDHPLGVGRFGSAPEASDVVDTALAAFIKRMQTGPTLENPQQIIFQPLATSSNSEPPPYPRAIQALTSTVPGIVFHSQQALKFAEQISVSLEDLTRHDVATLNLFLRPFAQNEQCLFEFVQRLLLSEDTTLQGTFAPFLELLSRTLDKLPRFCGNVWHKINKDLAVAYPKDRVFTWKAFLSCTVSFEPLEEKSTADKDTLISIFTSSGRLIQQFSEGMILPEVLILPGTYFQVISVLDTDSGAKIIQLKEVVPGNTNELADGRVSSPKTIKMLRKTDATSNNNNELHNSRNAIQKRCDLGHIQTTLGIALSLADIATQERCLGQITAVAAGEFKHDAQIELLRQSVTYLMKVYKTFSSIQIIGCRALMALIRHGELVNDLTQYASIGVVLEAMKQHNDVVSLHEDGLALLEKLCVDSATLKVLVSQNGIHTVLCSMRQHPGNKELNKLGCALLGKLVAISRDTVPTILESGGVDAAIGAIQVLRDEPMLQISGWRVLLGLVRANVMVNGPEELSKALVPVILQTMELYSKQVNAQAEGLLALRNLISKDANKLETKESLVASVTLSALRIHSQNEMVSENGCTLLADLTRASKNCHEVVSDGGITCLLSAMQQHFDVAVVQEEACRTLRNIAVNGSRGPLIDEQSSNIVSSGAMLEEPLPVADNGKTSFDQDPLYDYRLAITEAGGKEVIMLAMKTHPNHEGVQRQGCLALRTLSVSLANEVDTVKIDDLNVILSALTRHCNSVSLQRAALRTLVVLAVNPQNKAAIAKCGGLEVILLTLSTHPQDETLHESGMNMLNELSFNAFAGHHIVNQGGLRAVLAAMNNHSQNRTIQGKGCEILANISYNQETNDETSGTTFPTDIRVDHSRANPDKAKTTGSDDTMADVPVLLAEVGGIDHIVRAMEKSPDDVNVQKHGCRALAAMAVCAVNINMIIGRGGVDLVLSAMRQHSMNAAIQLEGCKTYCKVCVNKDPCNSDPGSEAIDVVIGAMNLHPHDNSIQFFGCKALTILADDTENRNHLVEYGAIDAVLTAMRSHQADILVQELGSRFLLHVTHLQSLFSEVKSIFLTAPETTARTQITSGGRLDTILQTMAIHENSLIIQILCSRLLLRLSANQVSRARVLSKGGGHFARKAMVTFADDQRLQDICEKLLSLLGETKTSP